MTEPVPSRPKVFISYSHKDEDWKDQFLPYLRVTARTADFDPWDDRRIQAGALWKEEITQAIAEASVAILLISVHFLDSDFIRNEEVRLLLEAQKSRGLRLVPVIVRSCPWKNYPWIEPLQARPRDSKPLAGKSKSRIENELSQIAAEIAQILETSPKPALSRKDQFLAAFRSRLAHEYSRWDLGTVGVTQSGGASRPIEADLDVMYLPLRLAEGFDISETEKGGLLTPEELLDRRKPLVIRGPAGAGKTTWIRWTFRQLLRIESAFPLMLVLRDLAARWQDRAHHGAARSLDTFLGCWIAEHMGAGWEDVLPELLTKEDGPRPVLLVDGWDELGPLGDELREKLLGFLSQHLRVLVVVTSRPYGEGRPSHADRFEVLDIQPLSDSEVEEFTNRFFTHCHGGEEQAVQRNAEHFQRALKNSPDAQALARTALLLTMMLLISRSRPLPDKRHLLYEACIENLLTALPNRKEQEGALLGSEQWRPDDSEERMRVVASLAAGLQEKGYEEVLTRDAIVHSWEEMATLLPVDWQERQKFGFLTWLAGPAGLLTDRMDGKLAFTHLSFQEYLTAWRLNAQVEGTQDRLKAFDRFLWDQDWWETLRLWAALIERQSRERLDLVLKALIDTVDDSLMLSGAIFADGLGTEERFHHWLNKFPQTLHTLWPNGSELCAQAWSSSRQDERRTEFANRLGDSAPHQTWLSWLRLAEFAQLSSLSWNAPSPKQRQDQILINQINGAPTVSDEDMAVSRLIAAGTPIWPVDPIEAGLLQLWPGKRRLAGARLQLVSGLGGKGTDLNQMFSVISRNRKTSKRTVHKWTREWAHMARVLSTEAPDLIRDLAREISRHWAYKLATDMIPNWAVYLAAELWTRDSSRRLAKLSSIGWVRGVNPWPANDIDHIALAEKLGIYSDKLQGQDFIAVDLSSYAWLGARVSVAYGTHEQIPLFTLLSEASRLSLHPEQDSSALEQSLAQLTPTLDPLWPALARHLARRSTSEDRALLTDLAQHPEKREPPLSWGLQFIVRGDVMLRDETVVTLDELADEAGLPHLPYLEDMPDELEVDWDK